MQKQYYDTYDSTNTQKFYVLMKLESYIILKLFLNVSDSGPQCIYKITSYKKVGIISAVFHNKVFASPPAEEESLVEVERK